MDDGDAIIVRREGGEKKLAREEAILRECVERAPRDRIAKSRRFRRFWVIKSFKKRSIKCLNKMQIAGKDPQPSGDEPTSEPDDNVPIILENGTHPPTNNGVVANDDDSKPAAEDEDSSSDHSGKRRLEDEIHADPFKKRLRPDLERHFAARDKILSDYMEGVPCGSVAQIDGHLGRVISEIKMLSDLACEKEREWNNIVHLKKIKEELLLRIQRKKQVMLLGELDTDSQPDLLKNIKTGNGLMIYSAGRKSGRLLDLANGFNSKLSPPNRAVIDVQSIIADYRQRHPEAVPRRGRRIRATIMSQGSGAQVKHNVTVPGEGGQEAGLMLSGTERDRHGKPPPPYSEVTVHPVTPMATVHSAPGANSSLLHGILTKAPHPKNTVASESTTTKATYSPTLARLLTAPERAGGDHKTPQMINEMLSSNKARNEITITPVVGQVDLTKDKTEDEVEDAADRLVIDESSEGRNGSTEELVDEVPQCQGCAQKAAQFVCAGCGNQWYCSRECQVIAWDDHSEVCSG